MLGRLMYYLNKGTKFVKSITTTNKSPPTYYSKHGKKYQVSENSNEPPSQSPPPLPSQTTVIADTGHPSDCITRIWDSIAEHQMFIAFCIALLIMLCLYLVHKLLRRNNVSLSSILTWAVLYILVFSIAMNYVNEYRTVKAKKYVVVQKGLPHGCMHHGGSVKDFFRAIGKMFFIIDRRDDACLEFTKAVMIDPLWEVPPTNAVAITLTNLVMTPLKVIAKHSNEMFIILFDQVPVVFVPFLCFFVLYLFTIIILAKWEYTVQIPWILSIEPASNRSVTSSTITSTLQEEIARLESLEKKMERLTKNKTSSET